MNKTPVWVIAVLAGCSAGASRYPDGVARFPEYPAALFDAVAEGCTEPAQRLVRAGRNWMECSALMPPDLTAALILRHDGTIEDLPRLVVRFAAEPEGDGYLVRQDVFVSVPQLGGGVRELRQTDARDRRMLAQFYDRTGGTPP